MVRVKEAGFDTFRIPVTWYRYTSDDGTYTIREDFLQHIREVVTWAREADLFVILNMHHEAWINEPNFAADAEKNRRAADGHVAADCGHLCRL